jgi:hypothetical protein
LPYTAPPLSCAAFFVKVLYQPRKVEKGKHFANAV